MASILRQGFTAGSQVLRINRLSRVLPRYLDTYSAKQCPVEASVAEESSFQNVTVKPFSEIPGPKRLPIVGSLFSMLLDKEFDKNKIDKYWAKEIRQRGEVVRMDLPGIGTFIIVSNPDDCEKLARVTMDNPVREGFHSFKKIRNDRADNFFEKKGGLLVENGDEWKRVRSRVQTPMMKPKNVASYLTQMDEVSLDFMERIAEFQNELGEMPMNFQTELYKWALESVSLVALNCRLGCLEPNLPDDSDPMILIKQANNIFSALNETEIGSQLWRFFPTPAYRMLQKSHDEFLRIADEKIKKTEAELLAKGEHSDEELTLMESLLLTPGLSRKDVVTLMLDMLFAGIDTTSHTIGFTLYLLAKNPRVQVKLQEEIDQVIGDYKGPLTSKHLGQLSYLKVVIKESLRMFPLTFGIGRTLHKDAVLGGYEVPKNTIVFTINMLMGKEEKLFPKADEFIPERWLRDRPLGPIHPYASLPFGLGIRMCIGRRIAEQEMYTFLARAMQRFSVDYKYQDMGFYNRMVLVPSEPLRFSFTERKSR